MAKLVLAKDLFETDYHKLDRAVRQKVLELPAKFAKATHTGVHLEKPSRFRDKKLRTVRVDDFWRGVVVNFGNSTYALLRVLPHDDAYEWAERQQVDINPVTGIVELLDVPTVEQHVAAVTGNAANAANTGTTPSGEAASGEAASNRTLFADVRDRELEGLGVSTDLIPLLRKLTEDVELEAIANYLPEAQADALLALAAGMTPEEAWKDLARNYLLDGEEVDEDDLDAAFERPATKARFIVTTDDDELKELLTGNFATWTRYLHPLQHDLAYKDTYNGPVRVTGGAGTGKTVVAMHRARHLARALVNQGDPTRKILVATYTKSLATNLTHSLEAFCDPEEFQRLDIKTVDTLASTILTASQSPIRPRPRLSDLAKEAVAATGLDEQGLDWRFLLAEWEQVVLARQIDSLAAYATSPRPGRGRRLPRAQRKRVWSAIEHLMAALAEQNQASFLQIADLAADRLRTRAAPPYAHAVIDEAQDLHPAQWRLLRQAVASGANDLFLVGDAHQRIYNYKVNLSNLGIETRGRGRSQRLRVNYRTSQEILHWSLQILTGETFDDLSGEQEDTFGYRSSFTGPVPRVERFRTPAEEADHVVEQIRLWRDEGVEDAAIGIASRTHRLASPVIQALDKVGIRHTDMRSGDQAGVRVDTMHSAKGLEFQRLALIGIDADEVPATWDLTPEHEDPITHAAEMQRERCLLYVACTRARDMLLVTSAGPPSPLLPANVPPANGNRGQ